MRKGDYTIWVDGTDITKNSRYLTKDEATFVCKNFKDAGYKDTVIVDHVRYASYNYKETKKYIQLEMAKILLGQRPKSIGRYIKKHLGLYGLEHEL
jgi:orotate phosphoribosyltransferase-like protein